MIFLKIKTLVDLFFFITHFYLLSKQKYKLSSEDISKDIFFTQIRFKIAALGLLAIHVFLILKSKFDLNFAYFFGIFLSFLGLSLRLWSIQKLGRFFTFEIGIRKNHILIETGPYKILRHPSYSGYLFFILGVSLIYQNLVLGLILFSLSLASLLVRIFYEEKMLEKHFGEEFLRYQSKTFKLIPFIY